ncbi:MAG: hypothetical protein ACM3Q1_02665 [Bacteroidales bacterium]
MLRNVIAGCLILAATSAQAAEIEFVRRATEAELAAAARDAPDLFADAAQARQPVDAWVGTLGDLTAIRLVSQALCGGILDGHPVGAMGACPVMAYQDLGKPPIWRGIGGEVLEWSSGQ